VSTIRTTSVGSWPIPFGQRLTLKRYYKGALDEASAYAALVAAARIAMDEQLACGLTQISGGEVFAPDFVHHIPPRLNGLSIRAARDTAKGYDGVGQYVADGQLSAPRGTGHAQAFRRERAIEPNLDKAAVPSPYSITLSFARAEDGPRHRDELNAIVTQEVHDMVAAGATEVQLDAPVEAIAAIHMEQGNYVGPESVQSLADWIAAPFAELAPQIRRSVHFCLGDISRKPASETQNLRSLLPLIQALDGRIDRALVECAHVGQWREHSLLADIPDGMEVVAGIADVKSSPQSVSELRHKIDALVRVVDPKRLALSASCGCGRMPHDEAIRLVRNLVKAAS
jgi:methionine synthase II (cobalamin-independent)